MTIALGAIYQAKVLAEAEYGAQQFVSDIWEGAMVRLGGLEPPTSGSTIRRSNQLSYNRTRSPLGLAGYYGHSILISSPFRIFHRTK
jgi:hypothetical protein